MLLELKLRKIGNSVGVILPKEVLAYLQAEEGDNITFTDAADRKLVVSAHKASVSEQMRISQSLMQRYRNTLRELAK